MTVLYDKVLGGQFFGSRCIYFFLFISVQFQFQFLVASLHRGSASMLAFNFI